MFDVDSSSKIPKRQTRVGLLMSLPMGKSPHATDTKTEQAMIFLTSPPPTTTFSCSEACPSFHHTHLAVAEDSPGRNTGAHPCIPECLPQGAAYSQTPQHLFIKREISMDKNSR
jgi:hypothetical protein